MPDENLNFTDEEARAWTTPRNNRTLEIAPGHEWGPWEGFFKVVGVVILGMVVFCTIYVILTALFDDPKTLEGNILMPTPIFKEQNNKGHYLVLPKGTQVLYRKVPGTSGPLGD